MRVTFLGTGSAMPTADRVQTGILLTADDRTLLVDCGAGVLHRLPRAGGYEGVGHVLLTHHHLDHVADLLPLLKARWLAGEETLSVAGPPGTEALVDGLLDVHDYLRERVDLTVRDLAVPASGETTAFTFGGFDVEAMETRHSMQCLAYRFGDDFAFSGDTEAFRGLAAFADGCAVLAHDCSFPDDVDVSNHPTPSQLGAALAGTEVGTVLLTHCYPHTDGRHEEMLASVADGYDGDVRFASDLETVRTRRGGERAPGGRPHLGKGSTPQLLFRWLSMMKTIRTPPMVTQNLPSTGAGACVDLLSCATAEFVALAIGTALFLLLFVAAAANVREAADTVERERDLVRAEADALTAFAKALSDLDASQARAAGGPGASTLVESGTTAGIEDVRRAYRETVMAVPHYESEYGESMRVNMAVEFGEDVAGAVAGGSVLTPQLKRTLVERARQGARQRLVLLEYLDDEADALAEATAEYERIAASIDRVADEPVATATYDELRAEWYLLEDRETECEAVLDDRQAAIQERTRLTRQLEAVDALEEYLYGPLSVTYPVLADGAALLERIRGEKGRIARGMSARA